MLKEMSIGSIVHTLLLNYYHYILLHYIHAVCLSCVCLHKKDLTENRLRSPAEYLDSTSFKAERKDLSSLNVHRTPEKERKHIIRAGKNLHFLKVRYAEYCTFRKCRVHSIVLCILLLLQFYHSALLANSGIASARVLGRCEGHLDER